MLAGSRKTAEVDGRDGVVIAGGVCLADSGDNVGNDVEVILLERLGVPSALEGSEGLGEEGDVTG